MTTDVATEREVVLRVDDLRTHFQTRWGTVKAVDGISFDLRRGETLGIVGESGSGKSVTMLSLMRLIPMPPGRIVSTSLGPCHPGSPVLVAAWFRLVDADRRAPAREHDHAGRQETRLRRSSPGVRRGGALPCGGCR